MRKVISIGYGRHLFESGNTERARLVSCAEAVEECNLILFSKRSHGLKPEVVSDRLVLYPTNSRYAELYLVDAFLIARRLIKQSKQPVVVTTQDPFETALVGLILKLLYRPVLIIQEHGDFFGLPYWRKESFGNRLRYLFGLFALKRADKVRVVSLRTKQRFEKRGIKHISTLPVAVDAEPFLQAQEDTLLKTIFGSDVFVFLSVARFVPQKNLPLLLDSFAAAHIHNPAIRLLLVGKGGEENRLRATISNFPKDTQAAIHILPWSSTVAGLMKASSAYVLSSNYEGWGRVLIEALLTKLPVVTTAVGCADEVVVNETHGLVVPVDDKEALTKAMLRISKDVALYTKIKENLSQLPSIPGADISRYKEQWAAVFSSQ
jgi:glycosyltransferase involved in cell wall biosynthesis